MRVVVLMLAMLLPASGVLAAPASYPPPYQPSYPQPYSTPYAPNDLAEPAMILRRGIDILTGYLDDNKGIPPDQLRQFLEQEIAPFFDFKRMSYWAAGTLNRYFTPQQRARFTTELRERFIGAMLQQLTGYTQTRLQYLRPRGDLRGGNVSLGVKVFSANTYPVQLDFHFYRSNDGWKVYDVVANGNSAVNHYRNEFSVLARQYGINGMLEHMQGKNN
jgi:phospholipid transport system substrate-binding protein